MTSPSSNPVPTGTVLTIAIPWIENSDRSSGTTIDAEFVQAVIDALELGTITKIDLKECKEQTQPRFKRAHQKGFIHFGSLNEQGEGMKRHLDAPSGEEGKQNEIKIWYSDDYFWKARKSRFEYKSQVEPSADQGFKPRVEF